jgi:hypothetical protein
MYDPDNSARQESIRRASRTASMQGARMSRALSSCHTTPTTTPTLERISQSADNIAEASEVSVNGGPQQPESVNDRNLAFLQKTASDDNWLERHWVELEKAASAKDLAMSRSPTKSLGSVKETTTSCDDEP